MKYFVFLISCLAIAPISRGQEKSEPDKSLRSDLESLKAEEIARDERTLKIWENQLEEIDAPFDDQEFFKVGTRLRRLSKPDFAHTPESVKKHLREAYRRKLLSDSEYVDWWVSMIDEERKTVIEKGGSWTELKWKSKLAVDVLRSARTEESVRAIGELLSDTRGSIREEPYRAQREHDYWSLAGAAVSALHAMNLEDPPEVEDERSYRWPETLIAEWQKWWAEVERGEREIRFKEEGAATEKDATTASAGARQRPAPADRPGARSPSPDSVPPPDPPTWIGWAALGFLAGLVALYFGLRRPAGGRLR